MSHVTAISNAYEMAQAPKEQTKIEIHVNGKRGRCPNHGMVRVKTITSFFLGYRLNLEDQVEEPRKIDVCSRCNSVIQQPAKEAPKPELKYKCFSCGTGYPAGTKFLKVVGLDHTSRNLVSGKMCPRCKEPTIFKVEKPE